jgi:hypothetical protein
MVAGLLYRLANLPFGTDSLLGSLALRMQKLCGIAWSQSELLWECLHAKSHMSQPLAFFPLGRCARTLSGLEAGLSNSI